jgi:hypothetical protein
MMGQVYKCAYCTISANISDPSQSLFLARDNQPAEKGGWLSRLRPGSNSGSSSGSSSIARIRETEVRSYFDNSYLSEWDKTLEGGILGKRGWCLQERHLSPRVLHVRDGGLWIWECNSRAMASDGSKRDGPQRRLRAIDIVTTRLHNSESKFKIWYDIVEDYSKRDLTVKSDKFTAISGIVHSLRDDNGSAYSAGLWNDDMTYGLLWKRDTREGHQEWKRCPESQAQSWSWGSIDGPVRFERYGGLQPLIGNMDIRVPLSGPDYAGQIKNGSTLVVSGRILHIVAMEAVDTQPACSHISALSEDRNSPMPSGQVCFDNPLEVIPNRGQIICLPVAQSSINLPGLMDDWQFGIALLLVDGSENMVRRVGMVDLYNVGNWNKNWTQEVTITIV